jgi:hypothetical protein
VELVSAQYCAAELESDDINLILIGSDKVNPITGRMLKKLQKRGAVRWRFGPANCAGDVGDYANALYRQQGNWEYEIYGRKDLWRGDDVHVEDHGLIVRGPHPDGHAGRIVTILAGAHSLGTAAACFAATDPQLVRVIADRGIDLASRDRAFWALVHGIASSKDGLLDLDAVHVLDAAYFPP